MMTSIALTNPEELRDIFKELLREIQGETPDLDRYITSKEVTEILSISAKTLWKYEREGIIPCYRVGRARRYKLKEILEVPRIINA